MFDLCALANLWGQPASPWARVSPGVPHPLLAVTTSWSNSSNEILKQGFEKQMCLDMDADQNNLTGLPDIHSTYMKRVLGTELGH